MKQLAAFFNWPLGELLKSETDNLNKASIRILFTILTLTLIKAVIGIAVAVEYNQDVQLYRAVVLLLVYSALLTSFLARKISFKTIAHALLGLGLLVIWTNIFVFAGTINIPVLQFNFMLILGSFYLLGKRSGIIYAILGTLPAIVRIIADRGAWLPEILSEELASPGFELIVVLNFATILLCHYQFLAAFRANIAEKEALNKQLQRAAEEANRAAEAKSEFLSTMTHELRTPLNSVIGVSQLLLQNSNADDQESLQILKFSAVNLYSLINNILDFNKLGSDKLGLEKIPVDLDALMNETCLGVRFQAERKGIGFQLDIDERIKGMWVLTDPTRITQIIYNLAGNAIKFTERGSVSVSLKLLSFADDNPDIGFFVTDTGIGISPDRHEAIFESFTQASAGTARNFGGTGLGLAIVKKLLRLFNSSIQLVSTPGAGSTFSFHITFPLHKEPATKDSQDAEPDFNLAGCKVLVAEDNQMNRLLLTKVFSDWNNTPDFALNGQEAIDKAQLHEYDVILMDIHMPLVNGYEASRAIRALPDPVRSRVPIIALTATVSDNLFDNLREAGMDDYLAKPFKLDELYSKLKQSVC